MGGAPQPEPASEGEGAGERAGAPPRRSRYHARMNSPLFSIGGSSGLGWQGFLDVCRACEETGYFAFYPSDHLMTVQAGKGPSPDRLDALTAMAAVSGFTTTLRLGVLVANNLFRHPVMTAKIFNTIDHASGGRAEFGLGAGWSEPEHRVHGFDFPPPAERIAMLDEALSVIRAIWTEEPANFEGDYYALRDAPQMPKPVQQPHPPIIVGGISSRILRVALKHADDWDQIAPVRQVARNIARFREGRRRAGPRPDRHALLGAGRRSPSSRTAPRPTARSTTPSRASTTARTTSRPATPTSASTWPTRACSARPTKSSSRWARWVEAGVNHFILTTPRPFTPVPLETFMAKVAPQFR